MSDLENNQNFIKEVLKIEKINKIKIEFNKKDIKAGKLAKLKNLLN
ncbi:hypothetical protein FWI01_08155 [Francisella tularensis subsp. holarctica]|nr:hypothetical protein [Francisella tularensis subsp. holarctica]